MSFGKLFAIEIEMELDSKQNAQSNNNNNERINSNEIDTRPTGFSGLRKVFLQYLIRENIAMNENKNCHHYLFVVVAFKNI